MIRTLDPLLPKQVRYQAALYSVRCRDAGIERFRQPKRLPPPIAMGRVIAALARTFKRFEAGFYGSGTVLRSHAKPCRNRAMLGCRQVVRHRFLVPAFPGSNPGTPANFT